MRQLRSFLLHVGLAAVWPIYLGLLSYVARVAPWPRTVARPVSFALGYLAVSLFIAALGRFLLGPGRWAERTFQLPAEVARQLRRVAWTLAGAGVLFLLPELLLSRGLIAPADRPIRVPSTCRTLSLAFNVVLLVVAYRLVRPRSPLIVALTSGPTQGGWFGRRHRSIGVLVLSLLGGMVGLDARGYAYTAHRMETAAVQASLLAGACFGLYRLAAAAIDRHAWRWARHHAAEPGKPAEVRRDDLAGRLKRLAAWATPLAALLVGSWLWRVDFALFRYIGEMPLLPHNEGGVTVGDFAKAVVILSVTAVIWRHLNDLFALLVFPRMSDDPGVRFAAVTLCRYAVLGTGLVGALSSLHMGLEKIGVVLAALGVGLGFGLQEIVSNFVSGIILLLERPIRVGDIVTVAGMSGRVDRINIRATTIINGDNQSIIVPNREFITANLVNWTHNDRIVRTTIAVPVAYGNCPDRVAELLLGVARDDEEVLRNPVPIALMESFGPSAQNFLLHIHVADPTVAGRVKHRVCARIQRRFEEASIAIPLPAQELHVRAVSLDTPWPSAEAPRESQAGRATRVDGASITPPAPRMAAACPQPAEPSHRGVDE